MFLRSKYEPTLESKAKPPTVRQPIKEDEEDKKDLDPVEAALLARLDELEGIQLDLRPIGTDRYVCVSVIM